LLHILILRRVGDLLGRRPYSRLIFVLHSSSCAQRSLRPH
jgi:hypothetical protein